MADEIVPYLSEDSAYSTYAGALDPAWVGPTRRMAARLVQSIAPAPDEPDGEYASAAADAELFVGNYLAENPGVYTSLSSSDGTLSYAARTDMESLVRVAFVGSNYVSGSIPSHDVGIVTPGAP